MKGTSHFTITAMVKDQPGWAAAPPQEPPGWDGPENVRMRPQARRTPLPFLFSSVCYHFLCLPLAGLQAVSRSRAQAEPNEVLAVHFSMCCKLGNK